MTKTDPLQKYIDIINANNAAVESVHREFDGKVVMASDTLTMCQTVAGANNAVAGLAIANALHDVADAIRNWGDEYDEDPDPGEDAESPTLRVVRDQS